MLATPAPPLGGAAREYEPWMSVKVALLGTTGT